MGIGRLAYFCLMLVTAAVAATLVHNSTDPSTLVLDVTAITLAESVFRVAVSCARAQNAGKSFWWGAVAGIPIVAIVPFVYLLIVPPKTQPAPTPQAGLSQTAALS